MATMLMLPSLLQVPRKCDVSMGRSVRTTALAGYELPVNCGGKSASRRSHRSGLAQAGADIHECGSEHRAPENPQCPAQLRNQRDRCVRCRAHQVRVANWRPGSVLLESKPCKVRGPAPTAAVNDAN